MAPASRLKRFARRPSNADLSHRTARDSWPSANSCSSSSCRVFRPPRQSSMRAALQALAAMGHGRRTWAVLGEMLELGPESVTEHDALGRLAVRLRSEE